MAAILKKKQEQPNNRNLLEYVCDTTADVTNLPTDGDPGSTAFVIETSAVYMLNSLREWKEI